MILYMEVKAEWLPIFHKIKSGNVDDRNRSHMKNRCWCEGIHARTHTHPHEYMNANVSANALSRILTWRSTPRAGWHGTQINSIVY